MDYNEPPTEEDIAYTNGIHKGMLIGAIITAILDIIFFIIIK